MKHWLLGLEEEGPDAILADWLEAQPDPEEAVKTALRAFAFGAGDENHDPPPADHPLLQQALASLRAAVADVEAAAGMPAKAARQIAAPLVAAATTEPEPVLSDELVDGKIGKLLDFDQERENADLPLKKEEK
ncbi:MAG: hypothetical protein ACYC5Y_02650 [Symbiobacteriia bacterium]